MTISKERLVTPWVAWLCSSNPTGLGQVEQIAQLGEGLGQDAVVGPPAALFAGDQAGVDEVFHVVTHSGLGDAELFGQVTSADFSASLGIEMRQHTQPAWVRHVLVTPGDTSAPL